MVIVAGGIGLAPLRPAIRSLLAHRAAFGRGLDALYGARTPADLLFLDEIEAWRGRLDIDVDVTVDAAHPEWRGNVGWCPGCWSGPVRSGPHGGDGLRAGGDDAVHGPGAARSGRGRRPDPRLARAEHAVRDVEQCGHCQLGPYFVCADGPVMPYGLVAPWLRPREV